MFIRVRNFKISEFFSHILINKSSRQKVNYVKFFKTFKNFPFKVIIDDFEDNLIGSSNKVGKENYIYL